MKIKTERISSELKKQISRIIADDVKDPRIGSALIGVTKVYVTPDLKYAKVYLSIYSQNRDEIQAAYEAVCHSAGFIREMLKAAVNIRLVPELKFFIDDSVDYSVKIDEILAKIHGEQKSAEDEK